LGAGLVGSVVLLAHAGPVRPVGTLEREGPRAGVFDGATEPVEVGAVARTGDEAAVIRLEGGAVLRLDPNSALRIDSGVEPLAVLVLAGRVSVVGPGERVLVAGAASRFLVPEPAEGADLALQRLQQAAAGRGAAGRAPRR